MSAYSTYLLSLSPAGYWRLGESSGPTAFDLSGNSRNGTYTPNGGTILYGQSGALTGDTATSVNFNSAPYVTVPADATLNTTGSFSIAGWMQTHDAGFDALASTNTTSVSGWRFLVNGGDHLQLDIYGNSLTTVNGAHGPIGTTTFTIDTWYFVVGVFDTTANTTTVYVNGAAEASLANTDTASAATHALLLGLDGQSDAQYGRLQDWAFWNRALTAAEISQLYTTGTTGVGPSTGPILPVGAITPPSRAYVLSNYQLQFLQTQVRTRYTCYLALHHPVAFQVWSQDLQNDSMQQATIVDNRDLLAQAQAPYAPQANLGPNRIGFVGEPLFFDGSRSTQRGNIPCTSFSWQALGSSSILTNTGPNQTTGSQASITWSTPGAYSVELTVTDRFGHTMTGTRQVRIYQDRPSAQGGIINLQQLSGQLDGGWTCSFTTAKHAQEILLPDQLPVGSFQPVTILCELEYEVVPGNWLPIQLGPYAALVPGQWYDDNRVLFSGYVQGGSAVEHSDYDAVDFQAATVDMVLQQCGIHNIGFYHTTYAAWNAQGWPTSLNTSTVGQGQLVADLTSEDYYRALLSGQPDPHTGLLASHSNVGQHHDLQLWRNFFPAGDGTEVALTYTNLTASEGTLWSALQDLATNEYAHLWVERTGTICIGPRQNMRGFELLSLPTRYGPQPYSQILNFSTELNGNVTLGAQTAYQFNQFGPNALPQPQDSPAGYVRDLSALTGPPLAAHIADVPVYDSYTPADPALFPWISNNWPQDLAIHPYQLTISENYTQHDAFVKLIGNIASGNSNVFAGWWPQDVFTVTGDAQLMRGQLPAGSWDLPSQIVLPDQTIGQARTLVWTYIWEMARRLYLDHNKSYSASVNLGACPWARLNDVVLVTRQRASDGPNFTNHPMCIERISFSLDLSQQTWATTLELSEITTAGLTPGITTPPYPAPRDK